MSRWSRHVEVPGVATLEVGRRGSLPGLLDVATTDGWEASRNGNRATIRHPSNPGRWSVSVSASSPTRADLEATLVRIVDPPLQLTCPGGTVDFGGDHNFVDFIAMTTVPGWVSERTRWNGGRGYHREGATFSQGAVRWTLSMDGLDGEGSNSATTGMLITVGP